MTELLLHNARIVLQPEIKHGGLLIRDGRIAEVFETRQMPTGLSARETIDVQGAYLAPGMIDIHIHGSAGVDVQNANRAELSTLSEFLLTHGVTGYFATFVPTDERGYQAAIAEVQATIARQDETPPRGARILGIHFEGPFVSHNRCGALQREHFRTYTGDPRSIDIFTASNPAEPSSTGARLMTLAPEVSGGIDLIRALASRGVRAFIGHTEAEPGLLDRAIEAGARHITHFPNALSPLHHRKPGAVAWGLLRDDVTIDCIADFHHVHPLMLRLMIQAKSAGRVALISDAIQPTGLGNGEYKVWDILIAVRDGLTALIGGPAAGTIAGSVITMRDALLNIASLGVPLHEAIHMAAMVPARAAGLEKDYGTIEAGKRADLFAFDEDFNVQFAVIRGVVALDKR
jgi:N-acetylglucosamine-6-phosphate deacetylase